MKKLALVAVTLLALSGCTGTGTGDLYLRTKQIETDFGVVTCVYNIEGGVDCNWP